MPTKPPSLKIGTLKLKRKGWATTTTSSHARGYGWNWEKIKRRYRAREPLCRLCRAKGIAVPWAELDHIVPKARGGDDEDANLQPLCKPCHKAKTARERGD